ncbi:MAG TPA: hypothetical protein VF131_17065, partial [Blastocatellia bacterium]|nr:hypothetical protein [Blastocatellia bacterium]
MDVREQVILREAGHFFARQETQLATLEEQSQNNYTRFERYLRSVHGDIAMFEGDLKQEAKRWFTTMGKRVDDCERL